MTEKTYFHKGGSLPSNKARSLINNGITAINDHEAVYLRIEGDITHIFIVSLSRNEIVQQGVYAAIPTIDFKVTFVKAKGSTFRAKLTDLIRWYTTQQERQLLSKQEALAAMNWPDDLEKKKGD